MSSLVSDRPWILVTGGAGFIGSALVLGLVASGRYRVVNLDALTYAGNLENLASLAGDPAHRFVRGDIDDRALVASLLEEHAPRAILHLAAESHVDRSISKPAAFLRTNTMGGFALLEAARAWWSALPAARAEAFRFVQVSTDEVFGSIEPPGRFSESSPTDPSSPYAASKAAADGMALAYWRTYGLPVVVTHGSNTYGPRQFPEKLVPLMIRCALAGEPLPVYGDGLAVRDWMHVEDHCAALVRAMVAGRPGARYLLGANAERTALEMVEAICAALDGAAPDERPDGVRSYRELITSVADRPGHDQRYAVDASRARRELGWSPTRSLGAGLQETVGWYLANRGWWGRVLSGAYREAEDWEPADSAKRGDP